VKNPSWRPYIILAIGLLAVSSSSVFIRFAQRAGAESFVIGAWRLTLATLVLTPIVLIRFRDELKKFTRREIMLTMLSGVFLAGHFASWVSSLEYTSVMISAVLVNTNPLWIALTTPFILKERIRTGTMIGIIIAIAGGIVIVSYGAPGGAKNQDAPLLGAALAVIGAITVSGYFLIGRKLRARVHVLPYIWMTYGTAAVVMCFLVLLRGQPVAGLPIDAYVAMTFLGIFPQLIGHSSYNYALGYLSAAYVTLTILAEPIGSTILAAILFREIPNGGQLFGMFLTLVALAIGSRAEAKIAQEHKEKLQLDEAATGTVVT
jgi:drug/metabolite transporter (DMT)-like permease